MSVNVTDSPSFTLTTSFGEHTKSSNDWTLPTILAVCVSLTVLILAVVAILAFVLHRWQRARKRSGIDVVDVVEVSTARRDYQELSQNHSYNIQSGELMSHVDLRDHQDLSQNHSSNTHCGESMSYVDLQDDQDLSHNYTSNTQCGESMNQNQRGESMSYVNLDHQVLSQNRSYNIQCGDSMFDLRTPIDLMDNEDRYHKCAYSQVSSVDELRIGRLRMIEESA